MSSSTLKGLFVSSLFNISRALLLVKLLNALYPMEVTLAGMVIEVIDVFRNTYSPMEVNCEPDSNVTVARLVQ